MIEHVVVISQGPNDIGFLSGLRDRLGCSGQIIDSADEPLLRQRGNTTTPRDARLIVSEYLSTRCWDIVVRITDGDTSRPQNVVREERKRFRDIGERFICGVCDRDIEHWMTLDPEYAAAYLCFDVHSLPQDRRDRSGFVKHRIRCRAAELSLDYSEVVARFVREAPPAVIDRWLRNRAFRHFYDQCIAAAARHDCPVNDERDPNRGDS